MRPGVTNAGCDSRRWHQLKAERDDLPLFSAPDDVSIDASTPKAPTGPGDIVGVRSSTCRAGRTEARDEVQTDIQTVDATTGPRPGRVASSSARRPRTATVHPVSAGSK